MVRPPFRAGAPLTAPARRHMDSERRRMHAARAMASVETRG